MDRGNEMLLSHTRCKNTADMIPFLLRPMMLIYVTNVLHPIVSVLSLYRRSSHKCHEQNKKIAKAKAKANRGPSAARVSRRVSILYAV